MGQAKKGYAATTVYLPRDLLKEIRKEAIDRETTISDLIVEAFATRMRVVERKEAPK